MTLLYKLSLSVLRLDILQFFVMKQTDKPAGGIRNVSAEMIVKNYSKWKSEDITRNGNVENIKNRLDPEIWHSKLEAQLYIFR